MKSQKILPILMSISINLFFSCNSKPTVEQYLKDDHQRRDVIHTMVHHQPYMAEMMHEMMNNDTCRQMMMDNMMNNKSMKGMHMDKMMSMCKDDTVMCKMMMGKTMAMCDADSLKYNMMMVSMQSHPNVMKSMKRMQGMVNMKK